ncbi:MAG: hypothetical protein MZU97_00220 [Bacillus subtilis]|nr:hypothetical protein [Bacillus subtilis]
MKTFHIKFRKSLSPASSRPIGVIALNTRTYYSNIAMFIYFDYRSDSPKQPPFIVGNLIGEGKHRRIVSNHLAFLQNRA